VRARREYLGEHRDAQARFRQLQRGAQAGAPRPDNDRIETSPGERHR